VDHRTVAVDLRDRWVKALRDSGFDPFVPTAWSAEGLLPYLPPDAQEQLLDDVWQLSAEGSWFAADVVADVGELAAQIANSLGVIERPSETRVEIGAAIATSVRERVDVADHLRSREWASMSFSALDLFAAYELPEPAGAESLYQHVRFVTAFRGHGYANVVVAGI
jgi:methyltransferase (TIGR00027 family)